MTSTHFFTHYQKTLLFGEQCKVEWELSEEWLRVSKEACKFRMMGENKVADQLIENFKLLAYREVKESFRKIDRFGSALWKEGNE